MNGEQLVTLLIEHGMGVLRMPHNILKLEEQTIPDSEKAD